MKKMDLYYTNKQIHLNIISYVDDWSMDKGKEHRKLVGKLIDYVNRLAFPLGCGCKSVTKTELCGSPFWYYTLYCHKCCFMSLKGNVFLVFGLMFLFFVCGCSDYLLFRNPCNAWVQEKGKKYCIARFLSFPLDGVEHRRHRKFCTYNNKSPVQKALYTAEC